MPVQGDIQQHAGIARSIPDAQAAKYLERPHMPIVFVGRRHSLDSQHELVGVLAFTLGDVLRNVREKLSGQVLDRKSVERGKSVTVSVDLGVRRIIKNKRANILSLKGTQR